AYNQFSSANGLQNYNSSQPSGDAGGNGRQGAQKVIIFETDGAPNTTATAANFTNAGAYKSYYNIRYNSNNPAGSEFPIVGFDYDNGATVLANIYAICNQICALDSASPPGYSSTNKKVKIHCIGFGPEFDPSSSTAATNKATLNQMQQ